MVMIVQRGNFFRGDDAGGVGKSAVLVMTGAGAIWT